MKLSHYLSTLLSRSSLNSFVQVLKHYIMVAMHWMCIICHVPFKLAPLGSTTDVVEASGPGEIVPKDYASQMHLGDLCGSYGGVGSYNTGLYGNTTYERGYGCLYGGGRGMYNNSFGGPIGGGNDIGLYGGDQDPNNQFGSPSSPPRLYISLMCVVTHQVDMKP
ncbi:hypothetical protein L1887_30318 [Cichorium endivia]|nr:hypothetical protein L1887_30318 [Cichorium endivia]